MKRRQFLKSVFGVAVGLAVVPSVVKGKPKAPMCATEVAERYNEQHPLGTRRDSKIYVKAAEKADNPQLSYQPGDASKGFEGFCIEGHISKNRLDKLGIK